MSVQTTIIVTAIALWFAQGWYLNTRLETVHKKLNDVLEQFNGLRQYLYEIDPQFDDERASDNEVFSDNSHLLAGLDDINLLKRKKEAGKRTLNTTFYGEQ